MIRSIDAKPNGKNLTAKTIRRVRRMIKAVLAEPEFYDQQTFGRAACQDEGGEVCGTVCCAAGWAVWLDNPKLYNTMIVKELRNRIDGFSGDLRWDRKAMLALNLKPSRNRFNHWILFAGAADWPEPFSSDYYDAETPAKRAKVMAARWEFFITTDGTDEAK